MAGLPVSVVVRACKCLQGRFTLIFTIYVCVCEPVSEALCVGANAALPTEGPCNYTQTPSSAAEACSEAFMDAEGRPQNITVSAITVIVSNLKPNPDVVGAES